MPGLNLAVYNAVSELPSGAANGTMAWISGSTNRLYISNGTAWYSTSAFSNVALSTYTLAGDYHHTALTKAELNDANNTWTFKGHYIGGISIDPTDNSIIIPGLETHWNPSATYRPAIWKLNNPSSGLPSLSWSSVLTVNYGNDPMSASDTDADGNVYYIYRGKTSGGDGGGVFAKVSPTGSLIWERLIYDNAYAISNGDSRMFGETIQIDKENNVAVIGFRDNNLYSGFVQKWDISQSTPSIIWSRKLTYGTSTYNGYVQRAVIDSSGNIYTTGKSNKREQDLGVPNPRQDIFVTKHSSDGTLQWQKHYCTSETPVIEVQGFATDSENNLILAGYGFVYDGGSQSDRDWILKLDTDGNILWKKHIGQDTDGTTTVDPSTRLGSTRNLLVDADDFIIVIGGSNRIGFFDPDGELIRSLAFSPGIGGDSGLVLDNNNNLVIVSTISVQQGADYLSSAGIYVLPSNSQLIETGTYNDTGNSLGIDVTISEYNDLVIYSNGADFEVNNGIATVTSITAATTTTGTTRASGSGYQVYNTALPPYGPVITGVTDASAGTSPFTLATDGTPTVITVAATDADGDPLTYSYSVSSGTLGDTTVSQADNVFTITPSTTEADAGTFGLTFSVNDGDQTTTSVAEFSLAFTAMYGDRGLFAGGTGTTTSKTSAVEYIDITTPGNAASFGTLNTSIARGARATNGTIAIFYDEEPSLNTNRKNYMTIPGNPGGVTASEAGNLSVDREESGCAWDGTYGTIAGGDPVPDSNYVTLQSIEYITIATQSDGQTFANLSGTTGNLAGTSDGTNAYYFGGYNYEVTSNWVNNRIETLVITTLGQQTNFGNLANERQSHSAVGNETYGVIAGGGPGGTQTPNSTMERIAYATQTTATSFGSLSSGAKWKKGGLGNDTYAIFAGGYTLGPDTYYVNMDTVTINGSGGSSNFGNLTSTGGDGTRGVSGSPA
jgi:hypothetical protein